MKIEHRKSAIDLTDLALGIIILGVVVSVGATILINIRNSQVTNLPTGKVLGESVAISDLATGARLSKVWGITVDTCNNNSQAGIKLDAANYTYSVDSGGVITISNKTAEFFDKAWSCNYTVYNTTDQRYALPNASAVGIGEYGNWFKIIVIVGVAAVILSLIFMAFGGKSVESTGGGIGGTY